jgi:hypothetical protein
MTSLGCIAKHRRNKNYDPLHAKLRAELASERVSPSVVIEQKLPNRETAERSLTCSAERDQPWHMKVWP